MTKTLNQIIFFPPPKSEYFYSNIGNQNIFLENNHTPPLEVKWSGPSRKWYTKPISKLLATVQLAIKTVLQRYCDLSQSRGGVNQMLIIKKSKRIIRPIVSVSALTWFIRYTYI